MNYPPQPPGGYGPPGQPPGGYGPPGQPPGGYGPPGQPPGGYSPPGQPPGGHGPPGYGPPGYGQPGYGQPRFGGHPAPRPNKSGGGTLIALLVVGLVLLVGGGAAVYFFKAKVMTDTVVSANDGHSEVTVPWDWDSLRGQLNAEASVEQGNMVGEEYLIVITEPKTDLPDTDLGGYAKICVDHLGDTITLPEISEREKARIGGRDALIYEVTGTKDYLGVAYYIAYVDGADQYHQIVSWTLRDRYSTKRPILKKAVESFREK